VNQAYRIFTDGSAIGSPGPGGWGVVVIQGKKRWEMSGAHPWTTISEMELVAAVQALRPLEGRARVELHSDSEYLIYGMRAFVSAGIARAGGTGAAPSCSTESRGRSCSA
jgi:ribonuclease HI